MAKEYRMEQHYAVSRDGVLSHINQAHDSNEEFYCPHCGGRMLKRCGNIRQWHFAHDWRENTVDKQCSYESYLHAYAKLRLKQWFEGSSSIILRYQQEYICKYHSVCRLGCKGSCNEAEIKTCDLKQVFTNCEVEGVVRTTDSSYRADLLLISPGSSRRLLIEINVSHKCTDKKRNSNLPIIEFDIESEDDIEHIIENDIQENEKVHFYGFKNEVKPDTNGLVKPVTTIDKFILYRSGKTFINKRLTCMEFHEHNFSAVFEMSYDGEIEGYWNMQLYGLSKAREFGHVFQNCCLCGHYEYNEELRTSYCKLHKRIIKKGHEGLGCSHFVLNEYDYKRCLGKEIYGPISFWNRRSLS